jgi:hypothetical protein
MCISVNRAENVVGRKSIAMLGSGRIALRQSPAGLRSPFFCERLDFDTRDLISASAFSACFKANKGYRRAPT